MNEIKDGGPAFPRPAVFHSNGRTAAIEQDGMHIRDYFATKALQGMLAHAKRYQPRPGRSKDWHEAISEEAYELADAMIRARGAA